MAEGTKPRRATPGTRHGNGAGYGGPAKGGKTNSQARKPGPGRPRKDVAAVIAAAKAERLEHLKDHLVTLALTAEREADQITATLGYLKHEDAGAAPARTEITVTTNVNRTLDG